MSPLLHRSAHLKNKMSSSLVVPMCCFSQSISANSLRHAVDPGLCMANLLGPAMRAVAMARPGLVTRGSVVQGLMGGLKLVHSTLSMSGQLSHVSLFSPAVGEAGCAKSHVQAC